MSGCAGDLSYLKTLYYLSKSGNGFDALHYIKDVQVTFSEEGTKNSQHTPSSSQFLVQSICRTLANKGRIEKV